MSDDRLAELAKTYAPAEKKHPRSEPGIRYEEPHGFTVIVGRNAKENEIITFKMAKSRDLWLHAQGYPGSHVIIQAENREVPFETIIFAAQLAAAYSKAGQSDNVPVDYTQRKNVWKPKGAAPGAVYMTQQKTVYVTPSRRPEVTD
jgi:predicted ribosome quality control (RQC) complex YloA/Tae2 family protein